MFFLHTPSQIVTKWFLLRLILHRDLVGFLLDQIRLPLTQHLPFSLGKHLVSQKKKNPSNRANTFLPQVVTLKLLIFFNPLELTNIILLDTRWPIFNSSSIIYPIQVPLHTT